MNYYNKTATERTRWKITKSLLFCYDKGDRKKGEWAYTVKNVIVFGRIFFIKDAAKIKEITTKLSYKFTTDKQYIEREIAANLDRTLLPESKPEHISGKLVIEA